MEKTSRFRHSKLGYVGDGTGRYAKSSQGTETKLVNKIMDALRRDLKTYRTLFTKLTEELFKKQVYRTFIFRLLDVPYGLRLNYRVETPQPCNVKHY